ncbi:hypothetical protein CFD26_101113 [Aspergillus turcosus]|uniref:Uncharacterized protein n=1 Tax=Aspergillus turcosus TaxID=1245748 RepID=A0A421CUT4_9EURO|nr:hypothetical protein CFD26_101113 [Aspergillus turcosus]
MPSNSNNIVHLDCEGKCQKNVMDAVLLTTNSWALSEEQLEERKIDEGLDNVCKLLNENESSQCSLWSPVP